MLVYTSVGGYAIENTIKQLNLCKSLGTIFDEQHLSQECRFKNFTCNDGRNPTRGTINCLTQTPALMTIEFIFGCTGLLRRNPDPKVASIFSPFIFILH
jgi:hypothetical protein